MTQTQTRLREHPITLNPLQVRAVLAGQQTQVRRLVDAQPPDEYPHAHGWVGTSSGVRVPRHFWSNHRDGEAAYEADEDFLLWPSESIWSDAPAEHGIYGPGGMECPYGSGQNCMKRADRLWVREAWHGGGGRPLHYAADGGQKRPWRSARRMPRAASRLLLDITGVDVQQLRTISAADAVREGMGTVPEDWLARHFPERARERAQVRARRGEGWSPLPRYPSPRQRFLQAWAQGYGKTTLLDNPWVWVISFQVAGL